MRITSWVKLLVLIATFSLSACATLDRFVEKPRVTITNIEILPSNGLQPRFAIDLNIINTNAVGIPLSGLAYDISLNGHELFTGATSEVSEIPAYTEVPLRVEVGANLFESAAFLASLLSGSVDAVDYAINAKLKVGGITRPFSISEKGNVSLSSSQ